MQSRRSHLINPLTALTSHKVKLKWTEVEQKAFGKVKHVVARDKLLAHPDFNKRFDIFMNSSNYQIGAMIIQYVKPMGLYSCKSTGTQTQYTLLEKEFLSIVEKLKKF